MRAYIIAVSRLVGSLLHRSPMHPESAATTRLAHAQPAEPEREFHDGFLEGMAAPSPLVRQIESFSRSLADEAGIM